MTRFWISNQTRDVCPNIWYNGMMISLSFGTNSERNLLFQGIVEFVYMIDLSLEIP